MPLGMLASCSLITSSGQNSSLQLLQLKMRPEPIATHYKAVQINSSRTSQKKTPSAFQLHTVASSQDE